MKKQNIQETKNTIRCARCGSIIQGDFKVVEGKYLGPGCYEVIQRRNRIRAQVALPVQLSVDFIETAICKTTCLNCEYLLMNKCPQEKEFKGTLGRRR